MIRCRYLNDESFVEIRLIDGSKEIYGAKISFSIDGITYQPCSIFRGKDPDSLIECTFWEWNQAVEFGNVKFNGKTHKIYWNLFLDKMHNYIGPVYILAEAVMGNETVKWMTSVDLYPGNAAYITDWSLFIQDNTGWKLDENKDLTAVPLKGISPLVIPMHTTGLYDIYLGIRCGTLLARLKMNNDSYWDPLSPGVRAEFQDKKNKEIFWKTSVIKENCFMEIDISAGTVLSPDMYPFGSLRYIKLTPVKNKVKKRSFSWNDKKLAIYTEPYGLDTHQKIKEVLEQIKDLGADEIHVHIGRFGAKVYHYSRIAERFDSGSLIGDDGICRPSESNAVKCLDLLRATIDICRELGVAHYANAGLTACYPGTDFEERISREHPDWRIGNILRYDRPETRSYAAGIAGEFAEWGTDAVSIDCMRYQYHHTENDLDALFNEIHQAVIAKAGGRFVPLSVRIPAGDVTYYRVFERLARLGIVQCVIPSTLFQREPWFSIKPYMKWQDHGCRIYGIIDCVKSYIGTYNNCQVQLDRDPRDIRNDIKLFFNEGADGIFAYGSYNEVFNHTEIKKF